MATKKMPDWMQSDFAEWKKIAWRAVRAFVGGSISAMGVIMVTVTPDVFESWNSVKKFAVPFGAGVLCGGITAAGKALREVYPESEFINKLPI